MPLAVIGAILALVVVTAPAAASPAGHDVAVAQDSAKKPPLSAKLEACTPDGYATFMSSMPALGSRGRMEVRFELQQRGVAPRKGWTTLTGIPSFGIWDGADAGVPGFIVRKRVGGLSAGGVYRAVVKYRWRNHRGRIVRTARRITSPCAQPNNRPDLQLRDPGVVRGAGDAAWTYRVTVVNHGAGAAGPFDVSLSLAGGTPVVQRVAGLAARERRVVEFSAPRCESGTGVKLVADSSGLIAESAEGNNDLNRRCAAR